jgi:3',5'-cyclic-AMP phosphodiesterase
MGSGAAYFRRETPPRRFILVGYCEENSVSRNSMSSRELNRREVIAGALGVTIGTRLPFVCAEGEETKRGRRRVLRFAHLTDVHVQTQRRADEGFLIALRHLQELDDPAEFVIFGGDNVMNVDSAGGRQTAAEQLATWNRCLRDGLNLPYRTCIGNHDVLGLDPVDGKKWAMDAFGLEDRYYHFDQAGWRFIVLDSTSPEGGSYKGRLDAAQKEWLKNTLETTDAATSVMIVSHIPILAACAYFDGQNDKSGDWHVPGAWMHIDARELKDIFLQHPNVRAALSGHSHLIDLVRYHAVTYVCNGAVSGGWWKGAYQECWPGYALIDLFDDGSIERTYIEHPWKGDGVSD